jgi:hypothetical protein
MVLIQAEQRDARCGLTNLRGTVATVPTRKKYSIENTNMQASSINLNHLGVSGAQIMLSGHRSGLLSHTGLSQWAGLCRRSGEADRMNITQLRTIVTMTAVEMILPRMLRQMRECEVNNCTKEMCSVLPGMRPVHRDKNSLPNIEVVNKLQR